MSEPLSSESAASIATTASLVATPGRFQLMIMLFVGICGPWFAFLIYGVEPLLGFRKQPDPVVSPQLRKQQEISRSLPPESPPEDTSEYASSESVLLEELQRIELEPLQGSVTNLLSEVQMQSAKLDRRLKRMLTDADGQRLATIKGVRSFRILRQKSDAVSESLRLIQDELQEERPKATGTLSTADLILRKSALLDVQRRLESSVQTVAKLNELMDRELKKEGATSGVTLHAALLSFQTDVELQIEEAVKSKLETSKSTDDDEIRALDSTRRDKRTSLTEAESELEMLLKHSASRLREIESSAEASARQRDLARTQARKAMEQALPAMRELLSPVISKGYRQPDGTNGMKVVVDAGPISLSSLMQYGALNDDKKGMESLFDLLQYGNAFGRNNDRPLGQFPKSINEFVIQKPAVIETVRKVQRFLIEHGDAMVEAGILSR